MAQGPRPGAVPLIAEDDLVIGMEADEEAYKCNSEEDEEERPPRVHPVARIVRNAHEGANSF